MAIGLGCMRLSTAPQRDEAAAIAVIRTALDAGATLVDTADAYAHGHADIGHNERLVREAVGDRPVRIVTKGGLTRPGGRWVPDGRARHLRDAFAASLQRLGRIDLYLLHAPDPRRSLATSVRALDALRAAGDVPRVGLCNVSRAQLEEAWSVARIDAVQVALSVLDDDPVRGGVIAWCAEHGVEVIAHSPLGGPKRVARLGRHTTLKRVGARHGVSPWEVALAALCELGITPIPGARRVPTAEGIGRALAVELDDADHAALDDAFPALAWLRRPLRARPRPEPGPREVLFFVGPQGAGKTTLRHALVDQGYRSLSRDERGGSLAKLVEAVGEELDRGTGRLVLDATWPTRPVRHRVVEAAWARGVPVRCIHLDTPLDDALVNSARRLVRRYGHLPDPAELTVLAKTDPGAMSPSAVHRWFDGYEPPGDDEGFTLEHRPFARAPAEGTGAATLVAIDALWDARPLHPDDVRLEPARVARICGLEGVVLGMAWFPELDEGLDPAAVDAVLARVREALGPIAIGVCGHRAGPPRCWCRRPYPGLGVQWIETLSLDPARCVVMGAGSADALFARRLGMVWEPWIG